MTDTQKVSFGNGKYSAWAEEQYNSMQELLSISPKAAEKIARQMATDLGARMVGQNKVSIGKVNKDNKADIKEALKVKGISLTFPLNIARAMEWAGEAFKNGINFQTTGWELAPEIAKYVVGIEEEVTAENVEKSTSPAPAPSPK